MSKKPVEMDAAEVMLLLKKKRHKYNAIPVVIDGIRFPSHKEGARYCQLKLLHQQGLISDLIRQEPFKIVVEGVYIGTWRADFCYKDLKTLARVVEDCKGFPTPVYKIKKRLVEALYRIKIVEV